MISPFLGNPQKVPIPPTTFDIETNGTNVIAVGFAWWDGEETNYRTYQGFDQWLSEFKHSYKQLPDRRTKENMRRIYAHYGAAFDWLFLVDWLESNKLIKDFEFIYSASFPIGVEIKIKGIDATIYLRDSYRLLPASLMNITKTFGVEAPKLALDCLPHELLETNPTLFWEYLKHDVIGLQQTLLGFWQTLYDLDGSIDELPMTLPSLSLRLWRKTLKYPIYTTQSKVLEAFERSSYFGGRVQVFTKGSGESKVFDINSLYPFVMRDNTYPVSYQGFWTTTYHPQQMGIYEVEYSQPMNEYPPLLRDAETNEFQYRGKGIYPSPELDRLFEIGGDFRVIKGYVYIKTDLIFHDFIETWWDRRLAAQNQQDDALSYVAKILMNSLYGKMGQRKERESIKLLTVDEQKAAMADHLLSGFLGDYSVIKETCETPYAFPAIASFVTSYARVELHKRLCQAVDLGGKLWYCDTDSIHTTVELSRSKDLGGLKCEYEGSASYAGRKLYALHESEKVVAKGASAHTITTNDIREFVDHGARKTIEFWRFPTFREVLSHSQPPGTQVKRTRTFRSTA